MDERLEKALNYSNYMVTFNNQKRIAKEKFLDSRYFYLNGGKFFSSIELINYLSFLVSKGMTDTIVLDENENPIKVENLTEFLDNIQHTYFFALNEYYQTLTQLKSSRKVEKLVE